VAEIFLAFLLDSVAAVVGICLFVVVLLTSLAVRRRVLSRAGGAFSCALRRKHAGETTPRGWILGVARYADEQVEWFRIFSLSPRPQMRLGRRALAINERRSPQGIEAYAVPHESVVLMCTDRSGPVDLALPAAAATGLLVWLEAVPPGAHLESA
jgi:Protein of unknown function (DUF2550)